MNEIATNLRKWEEEAKVETDFARLRKSQPKVYKKEHKIQEIHLNATEIQRG